MKAFYFLWRRPDMSREAFIDYYEGPHVDLIVSGLPRARDFRRNYPRWHELAAGTGGSRPFDVLTGITYESPGHFKAAMDVYHAPPFSQAVTADELRFIDRELIRFVPVDEVIDGAPSGQWQPAPASARDLKLVRLVWRGETETAECFRDRHETEQAPRVRQLAKGALDYRRNYLRVDDPFGFVSPNLQSYALAHPLVFCDLIEEISFASCADAQQAQSALAALTPGQAGARQCETIAFEQRIRAALKPADA